VIFYTPPRGGKDTQLRNDTPLTHVKFDIHACLHTLKHLSIHPQFRILRNNPVKLALVTAKYAHIINYAGKVPNRLQFKISLPLLLTYYDNIFNCPSDSVAVWDAPSPSLTLPPEKRGPRRSREGTFVLRAYYMYCIPMESGVRRDGRR